MACESAMGWSNVVTWGLVLAGWVVVHKMTLFRERRKENRDAVTRFIDEMKAVEDMAIRFHTADKFDAEGSHSLICRVGRLNRMLQRQPLKALNMSLALMIRFKKGLTLKNTDASSFKMHGHHSDLVVGIRDVTNDMLEAIEAAKNEKFG